MIALLVVSTVLQFLAAYLSIRFVHLRRLGRPWLLVSLALVLMGGLRLYTLVLSLPDDSAEILDPKLETVALMVSLLLASGFALTERWFLLRERLEGRFRLLAEVDRLLVGILDEEKILSTVCDILSCRKDYRKVWVGSGEPDGSVRILRQAGAGEDLLQEAEIRWDDTPKGQGPTGKALRTGGVSFVNRLDNDPSSAPWRRTAAELCIGSAASVRIEPDGPKPLALTIYAEDRYAFDRLEVESLAALAHRIGLAVQSARRYEFFSCAKKAYDELLKTQRDGVILVRERRIVRVNRAAIAMLGYSLEEDLVGQSPVMILKDPGKAPELQELLCNGREEGDTREHEALLRRKDGSTFEGEIAVTWVQRNHRTERWTPKFSGPLGMIHFRDITQRKKVLEDLRKERDFSAIILDTAGVLVARLGREGEILLLNQLFEEVTGYPSLQAAGQEMAGLMIHKAARDSFRGAYAALLAGEAPTALEFPLLTRGGEVRLIAWNPAVVQEPGGRTTSVILTGTDVTERRRLEQQVIQMQKMEAVGTLAGGIAHDFNNLLTAILGNLDMVCDGLAPGSPAARLVQESIKASERAARMVRQLLDFSRRSPSERRAIDLCRVAWEVADLFGKTIDRRITVETDFPADPWLAKADPNQMHQVLMNLCVNARDAVTECLDRKPGSEMSEGGYRIRLVLRNAVVDEDHCRKYPYARLGNFVEVSISDNGTGMDEATQRRVFEPFFTTKKLGRGTGLGLSTVYGIVKQHEGWINLDSRPGEGTTFRIYLPRAAEREEESVHEAEPARSRIGKETILLVDDEEMIRLLGRQVLESRGYTVLLADEGQSAIDTYLVHRDRIDLVILDLTMPHLSGAEVLARIRSLHPTAKVILSSGYPSEETSCASAFLPKPYRPDDLTRVVREVLDGPTS